jgi:pSer/pThr/pTyr-binding forkhead associated (FHA) protein
LNDERVSRFHVKIQEDDGRIILTDLDSTNGTRINGHPVQMRVLQPGDQLGIGRSLLLFGSEAEIAARAQQPNGESTTSLNLGEHADRAVPGSKTTPGDPPQFSLADEGCSDGANAPDAGQLFPSGPPPLPERLRISQMAQLSDVLAYLHELLTNVCECAQEERAGATSAMRLDWAAWQRLLKAEMQLARYLRSIAEPDGADGPR